MNSSEREAEISSSSQRDSSHASHVEEAKVSEEGRYLLRGLKPGLRYRISVVLPRALSSSSSLSLWEGVTPQHRDVLIASAKDISGRLFSSFETPPVYHLSYLSLPLSLSLSL